MMSRILSLLTTVGFLLLATNARGADATIKEVEKAIGTLNEAFHKQDAKTVKRLMTEDHVAVTAYYGGAVTGAEQLATLPDLKLSEYKATGTKVTVLGKDTALVTYELALKGTFKGKEVPRRNYASAVWVKRDGAWREAFYQETPLDGK